MVQFVGTAEIAHHLGIAQPETINARRRRHDDVPDPVTELRVGLIWSWPDVERRETSTVASPAAELPPS